MTATNKPMTGEQLDELMTVAVNMQRTSEEIKDRGAAMFAYAVQVAVMEVRDTRSRLAESQREFRSADATIENLQMQVEKMAAENAGLVKFIKDDCFVYTNDSCEPVDAKVHKPETPVTDAFLAEVRAQGVDVLAKTLEGLVAVSVTRSYITEFADKIRQGGAA